MISVDAHELSLMAHWITEREGVRKLKELGAPKPWTSDPLLRDYRWCNVRRMDDRVSIALMQNWYPQSATPTTFLAAALFGRLINWPDSLLEITTGQPFDLKHMPAAKAALMARAARGEKVFTGAYVVPGVAGRNKVDSICDLISVVTAHAPDVLGASMRETWSKLIVYPGLGSFLAGQVVADLAHLPIGKGWPDSDTWAPIGPGSARGLNRLMGRPKDKAMAQSDFEILLPQMIDVVRPLVPEIWAERRLTAFDFQNDCCELDKFSRLQKREGSVRARYNGAAETNTLSLWD